MLKYSKILSKQLEILGLLIYNSDNKMIYKTKCYWYIINGGAKWKSLMKKKEL